MSDIVGVYKFMKSNIKNQGGGLSHPRVGPWQRVGSQISCIGCMSYQKKNQSSSSYTGDSAKKWLIDWFTENPTISLFWVGAITSRLRTT